MADKRKEELSGDIKKYVDETIRKSLQDERSNSKKRVNKKEPLTLNDKDFVIKDQTLILNKELEVTDLEAYEFNMELSSEMMQKIAELEVKKSIQSEIAFLDARQYQNDGSPTPVPARQGMQTIAGSQFATTWGPGVVVPRGFDPLLPPRPPVLIPFKNIKINLIFSDKKNN